MAFVETSSNTLSSNVGSEDTLLETSTGGVYQLTVSLANLTGSEEVTLRIYTKVRSSSSASVVYTATYKFAQGTDNATVQSPPFGCPHYYKATLTQTGGSSRQYAWSVANYAG